MEAKILGAVYADRNAYTALMPCIDTEKDLSSVGEILYNAAKTYYDTDPNASRVDCDLIEQSLRLHHKQNPKLELIIDAMRDLGTEEVSSTNVVACLRELKQEYYAQEAAKYLSIGDYAQANLAMETLAELRAGTDLPDVALDTPLLNDVDIGTLVSGDTGDFTLWPTALNDKVQGRVKRKHHIGIFARTEVGKSMFCINMCVGFCAAGHKVLYLGNEDPEADILARFISRFANVPVTDVWDNTSPYLAIAREKGYKNLYFLSSSGGDFALLRRVISSVKPDVVLVDQVRNLKLGTDGAVATLEAAGKGMRGLAKEFNLLAISVTQAGDSARDKLVLTEGDIDSSKTGFPAQVDLLIGVGANDEFKGNGRRMISLCKNKISGDHSYFPVKVDPLRSKISGL